MNYYNAPPKIRIQNVETEEGEVLAYREHPQTVANRQFFQEQRKLLKEKYGDRNFDYF